MTEYTTTIFKCPVCGYITNNPVGRKSHEDLICKIKMDRLELNYEISDRKRHITLKIANHLRIDINI